MGHSPTHPPPLHVFCQRHNVARLFHIYRCIQPSQSHSQQHLRWHRRDVVQRMQRAVQLDAGRRSCRRGSRRIAPSLSSGNGTAPPHTDALDTHDLRLPRPHQPLDQSVQRRRHAGQRVVRVISATVCSCCSSRVAFRPAFGSDGFDRLNAVHPEIDHAVPGLHVHHPHPHVPHVELQPRHPHAQHPLHQCRHNICVMDRTVRAVRAVRTAGRGPLEARRRRRRSLALHQPALLLHPRRPRLLHPNSVLDADHHLQPMQAHLNLLRLSHQRRQWDRHGKGPEPTARQRPEREARGAVCGGSTHRHAILQRHLPQLHPAGHPRQTDLELRLVQRVQVNQVADGGRETGVQQVSYVG